MQNNTTMGYHRPGEFHYFSVFKPGNQFLGTEENEEYRTPESFAGLVTAVHEHYHLIQDLSQGFFWWRQNVCDALTALGIQCSQTAPEKMSIPMLTPPADTPSPLLLNMSDPLSAAAKYWLELQNIDKYSVDSQLMKQLLSNQVSYEPALAPFICEAAYELSTMDLIECHVALLTELYISNLIATKPDRFDTAVVSDLAPMFRLNMMPKDYQKPLQVLLHVFNIMKRDIRFPQEFHETHPVYRQIEHAPLYLLLQCLLDYALHVPPDPMGLLSVMPDAGTSQDIHPPYRFFNLSIVYAVELEIAGDDEQKTLTNESLFYPKVMPLLSERINLIRTARRGIAKPQTFFTLDVTTDMWSGFFEQSTVISSFPESYRVRRNSWRHRKTAPHFWLDLDPFSFDVAVELPKTYATAHGPGFLPYVADRNHNMPAETEALKVKLSEMVKPFFEFLYDGRIEKDSDLPSTVYPTKLLIEVTVRSMLFKLAVAVLATGRMRCPLTESAGCFFPCSVRTGSCEKISHLSVLPSSLCALRNVADEMLGGVDRFNWTQQ